MELTGHITPGYISINFAQPIVTLPHEGYIIMSSTKHTELLSCFSSMSLFLNQAFNEYLSHPYETATVLNKIKGVKTIEKHKDMYKIMLANLFVCCGTSVDAIFSRELSFSCSFTNNKHGITSFKLYLPTIVGPVQRPLYYTHNTYTSRIETNEYENTLETWVIRPRWIIVGVGAKATVSVTTNKKCQIVPHPVLQEIFTTHGGMSSYGVRSSEGDISIFDAGESKFNRVNFKVQLCEIPAEECGIPICVILIRKNDYYSRRDSFL